MYQSDVDLYSTLFDQGQIETPLASDSSLTVSQEQKFTIREISPEWGYATEPTKVSPFEIDKKIFQSCFLSFMMAANIT